MTFGKDHYTHDWDFLEKIANEWADVREQIGLGSKATQEQIEEHWSAIFLSGTYPSLKTLFFKLLEDEALIRHLGKCNRQELQPSQRCNFLFEDVRGTVLMRISWEIVRNAHKWLKLKGKLHHWARFWNRQGLTKHLKRAFNVLFRTERSRRIQIDGEGIDTYPDPNAESPERPLENAELRDEAASQITKHCTEAEANLLHDYVSESRELTDDEKKEIRRILKKLKRRNN